MITFAQLRRFVMLRNKSGFDSNLQFECDATSCGFTSTDLGNPEGPITTGAGYRAYLWNVEVEDKRSGSAKRVARLRTVRLIEFGGILVLEHEKPVKLRRGGCLGFPQAMHAIEEAKKSEPRGRGPTPKEAAAVAAAIGHLPENA